MESRHHPCLGAVDTFVGAACCSHSELTEDVNRCTGRKFVEESLASLCHHGAKIVRLDAFGYATKKPGTRCFFEVERIGQKCSLWICACTVEACEMLAHSIGWCSVVSS